MPRVAGRPASAFVLLLMLATIWQSCLLGTHSHAGQPRLSATASQQQQVGKAPSPVRRLPLPADHCPLCQEAASAGVYLPVLPAVLAAPFPLAAWHAQSDSRRPVDRQRSHAWRSRAPPTLLQA